jgi:hypothetical protein
VHPRAWIQGVFTRVTTLFRRGVRPGVPPVVPGTRSTADIATPPPTPAADPSARPESLAVTPSAPHPRALKQRTPGQIAFLTALGFARKHRLPRVIVARGDGKRIVVNVPNQQLEAWTETFSSDRGFMEIFFSATLHREPEWSRLRIDDRAWESYGEGEPYTHHTRTGRLAFPVLMTPSELAERQLDIQTTPNQPFKFVGGLLHGECAQNCTDWLTAKLGDLTGVRTGSVLRHARSLTNGPHSERMSVMAVMSYHKLLSLLPDDLKLDW